MTNNNKPKKTTIFFNYIVGALSSLWYGSKQSYNEVQDHVKDQIDEAMGKKIEITSDAKIIDHGIFKKKIRGSIAKKFKEFKTTAPYYYLVKYLGKIIAGYEAAVNWGWSHIDNLADSPSHPLARLQEYLKTSWEAPSPDAAWQAAAEPCPPPHQWLDKWHVSRRLP